jgi:MFS transporter, DHA2 family, multidrug resistance protein
MDRNDVILRERSDRRLPREAIEAARSTLGGAVAVASQLPGQLGAELLHAARAAFTQAFELTAAISAAVSLVTAIVVMVLLRSVRAGSQLDEQPSLEHAVQVTNPT